MIAPYQSCLAGLAGLAGLVLSVFAASAHADPMTFSDKKIINQTQLMISYMPFYLSIDDLNNDGFLDIITTEPSGYYEPRGQLVCFYNQGDMPSTFTKEYLLGAASDKNLSFVFATGDLNHDSHSDLILHNLYFDESYDDSFRTCVFFYDSESSSYLENKWASSQEPVDASFITLADVNGDQAVDIVVPRSPLIVEWHENTLDPDQPFIEHSIDCDYPRSGYTLGSLYCANVADINQDGYQDIVTGVRGNSGSLLTGWYQFFMGSGDGEFVMNDDIITTPSNFTLPQDYFYLVDINQDGLPDIVQDGEWYENMGGDPLQFEMHFIDVNIYASGDYNTSYPFDIDLDGDIDLICVNQRSIEEDESYDLKIIYNVNGTFSKDDVQIVDSFPRCVSCVRIADIDNDGDPDIILSTLGDLMWYENQTLRNSVNEGLWTMYH